MPKSAKKIWVIEVDAFKSWTPSRYLISLFSCLLGQDSVCYLPLGWTFRLDGFTVKSLGLHETVPS